MFQSVQRAGITTEPESERQAPTAAVHVPSPTPAGDGLPSASSMYEVSTHQVVRENDPAPFPTARQSGVVTYHEVHDYNLNDFAPEHVLGTDLSSVVEKRGRKRGRNTALKRGRVLDDVVIVHTAIESIDNDGNIALEPAIHKLELKEQLRQATACQLHCDDARQIIYKISCLTRVTGIVKIVKQFSSTKQFMYAGYAHTVATKENLEAFVNITNSTVEEFTKIAGLSEEFIKSICRKNLATRRKQLQDHVISIVAVQLMRPFPNSITIEDLGRPELRLLSKHRILSYEMRQRCDVASMSRKDATTGNLSRALNRPREREASVAEMCTLNNYPHPNPSIHRHVNHLSGRTEEYRVAASNGYSSDATTQFYPSD